MHHISSNKKHRWLTISQLNVNPLIDWKHIYVTAHLYDLLLSYFVILCIFPHTQTKSSGKVKLLLNHFTQQPETHPFLEKTPVQCRHCRKLELCEFVFCFKFTVKFPQLEEAPVYLWRGARTTSAFFCSLSELYRPCSLM